MKFEVNELRWHENEHLESKGSNRVKPRHTVC